MSKLVIVTLLSVVIFISTTVSSENQIYTNEDYPGSGIILTPGVELVLSCNYSDKPLAVFQWLKDGRPLNITPESHVLEPPTNNVLTIKKALESDCGNYTCISGQYSALIAVRSVVKLGPFENSRNVVQGQSIVLVCNVTQGQPLPVLKWYKDDQEVNISDPRITMKTDDRGIEGSELIIADATFEDRADYTCNATNEISSVNATILVRVKDKYAALWPFLGICAEVAVLCTIIFIYEKRRQKPDFDESETEHNTENKNVPDQEDKSRDVRQRK